jgi:hypothetical protein
MLEAGPAPAPLENLMGALNQSSKQQDEEKGKKKNQTS